MDQKTKTFSCNKTRCTCNYFNYSGGKPEKIHWIDMFFWSKGSLPPFSCVFFVLIKLSAFTFCFIHEEGLFSVFSKVFSLLSSIILQFTSTPLPLFHFLIFILVLLYLLFPTFSSFSFTSYALSVSV